MKLIAALFVSLSLLPLVSHAAEPAELDVRFQDGGKERISLKGPNAFVRYMPNGDAETVLEFRLIAPEPLIVDVTESLGGHATKGRVKLVASGDSIAAADIKNAGFHSDFVLSRP